MRSTISRVAGAIPLMRSGRRSQTPTAKRKEKIMKKLTSLALIIALGIVSCSPIKQNRYQDGTYTAVNSGCGYIITADGNAWEYFDRTIPDGSSILVTFSDEGTEEVEDDVITSVVAK